MLLIKIWWRIKALIQLGLYKLIFGERLRCQWGRVKFRNNFHLLIENGGNVAIGKGVFFNNDCSINCLKSIQIGDDCIFGEGVRIYDHNHRFRDRDKLIKNQGFKTYDVVIGKNCWIGSNVVILGKTNIGDNCVIGAGCIINSEIPSGTCVVVQKSQRDVTVSK